MPDLVTALTNAGFSTDEVQAHLAQQRQQLKAAGFDDKEIDAHFGAPQVPDKPPQALVNRVSTGMKLQQAFKSIASDAAEGFGSGPLGLSDEDELALANHPALSRALHAPLLAGVNAVDLAKGADLFIRAMNAGIHGGASALGQIVEGATGSQGEGEEAKNETMNFANFLMVDNPFAKFTRIDKTPEGRVPVQVGALPKAEDVTNAGNVLTGGDTSPAVESKLTQLYTERGVHPSEVPHDAQTDPTITQSMVSADGMDLPDAYQFHGYEPEYSDKIKAAVKSAQEKGIDAATAESYFQNITRGSKPKPVEPIHLGGGAVEENLAGIADNFDIKPLAEPEDQSRLMPQGKTEAEYTDAEKSVLSKISTGEKAETAPITFDKLYTNFIDKLFPLEKAVKESGAELTTENNPYERARLLSGFAGKADHFLNQGTFDFNTYKNNGPSLKQILRPVSKDLNGFRAYAAAARAMELEGRGIKSGFAEAGKTSAPPLVSTGLDAARTVLSEGAAKYEKPFRDLVDYQNRVTAYLRDSGVLSDAGYKAMLEANKMYVPFSRVMGIDEDAPIRGGSSLQAHNPIKAIKGSARSIVDPIESIVRNTYHAIEMAERNVVGTKLVDLLHGMSKDMPEFPAAVDQMDIKSSPRSEAIAKELGEIMPELKRPKPGSNRAPVDDLADALAHASEPTKDGEISILRDGKRESYKVDPELARAMKGLDRPAMGFFERMLAGPARVLRAGAVLTPEFWGRHIIRDYLYAGVTSKVGNFTPIDMAKGLAGLVMKDNDYWEWLKGGGGNISVASMDRQYLQADIQKLTGQTGLIGRSWNVLSDPNASMWDKTSAVGKLPFQAISKFLIDPLRIGTQFAENVSHLGAFKKAMRQAGPPADNLRSQVLDAAFKSRDTAVDASRMGASMSAYNQIVAFGNIKLQDTDVVAGALRKNPLVSLAKIVGSITVPSVLLWSINHDDPDYQELPQWEKDFFWIVPVGSTMPSPLHVAQAQARGEQPKASALFFARIPKPWAMGMTFGSGVERLLEAYTRENPDAFKDYFKSLWEASGPSIVPTAAAPIIEQFANRSTFTNRTLIPAAQEKFLPEYQYTPYTTEAAKALGKMIGAFPGISELKMQNSGFGGTAKALTSPILIENYLRGWTGTLGMYALKTADLALRKSGELPDPTVPTATLADIPIIRAFVVRYPTATTESIQKFYDQYAANKSYFDTYMGMAQQGDTAAMQHIQDMGGPVMFARLDGINQVLGQHSRMISDIYRNPDMKPDEKRQMIDQLYYSMIQLGQYGNQAFDQIRKSAELPAALTASAVGAALSPQPAMGLTQ